MRTILKGVIKRKNICRILYISFALEFFYALMIIYVPIYMLSIGLDWSEIGIIFTAMLLPFIFLQYPAGILADKKMGEKKMLFLAMVVMGVSALAVYFISSTSILLWSLVLFAGRVGVALVEILRDSYFYKRIDGYDIDMINIFRTALPLAYIVASILSAGVIYIFSIKAVFILVGVVVLSALYPVFCLVDNEVEKK
jgi:MFS family permease